MKYSKSIFVFIFISGFLFTGCLGVNQKFERTRDKIFAKLGQSLSSETEFSIGSFGIFAAKIFVKFNSKSDQAEKMLRYIDNIQLGVYQNNSGVKSDYAFDSFKSFDSLMAGDGYKLIVCSIDGKDATGVYVEDSDDEVLHKIFIITFNNNELVLTEVEGNLNKVLAEVIKDKKLEVDI